LPPLIVLSKLESGQRLSLLEEGVKGALKTDHVPQLRQGSNKTAAVVSLGILSTCLDTVEALQAIGFNESGELHLYVDRDSSTQQTAAGKLADPAACNKAGLWHSAAAVTAGGWKQAAKRQQIVIHPVWPAAGGVQTVRAVPAQARCQ
jgi:hypothetical protein